MKRKRFGDRSDEMIEKKPRKKKFLILVVIFLILLCVGVSYALWQFITSQTNPNKIASTCLDISLTSETDAIKMENTFPITDEEGMETSPYTFTITNTCNTFLSYEVILGMTNETTLKSEYIAAVLDTSAIETLNTYESTEVNGYKEARILRTGSLSSGDEVTYNLRLWMDEDVEATEDAMNKTFASKVIVRATVSNYSPVDQGFTTLADAMLVNEYQSSTVESAKAQIESKQAPDFTQTAPIIIWSESHANTTTTTSATMPHPDLVGNGESYSAGLTVQNVLPRIGTSYTFDDETGKYTIENLQYLDPTTLNYDGETKYYFCQAGFNTNSSDLIIPYQNVSNCTTIYQIVSATSSDGTRTGSGGTFIKTKVYQMTAYAFTQSEQESDKSDRGLYMMEDQDGKSYYYRGSVSNNYVQFAGYYWRIIRQNGDGSVRLLYAGTSANATGDSLQIRTNAFNSTRTNPGYVGYMYGSTFNTSYEQTHANENDSSIKTQLDSWYKTNIVDKNLEQYIADSGFCNDRSLDSGNGVSTTATTYFKGFRRYVNHEPSLICPNASNDLFTVSNEDGNQALTYPIGLITVDELMLGGLSDGYLNRLSYTYSSSHYWTMSPRYFEASAVAAREFYAYSAGSAGNYIVTYTFGVRPVINLAADTPITGGIGTQNDSYIVE